MIVSIHFKNGETLITDVAPYAQEGAGPFADGSEFDGRSAALLSLSRGIPNRSAEAWKQECGAALRREFIRRMSSLAIFTISEVSALSHLYSPIPCRPLKETPVSGFSRCRRPPHIGKRHLSNSKLGWKVEAWRPARPARTGRLHRIENPHQDRRLAQSCRARQ